MLLNSHDSGGGKINSEDDDRKLKGRLVSLFAARILHRHTLHILQRQRENNDSFTGRAFARNSGES